MTRALTLAGLGRPPSMEDLLGLLFTAAGYTVATALSALVLVALAVVGVTMSLWDSLRKDPDGRQVDTPR